MGTFDDNTAPSSPTIVAQQEKTPPPRPSLLEAGGNSCEEPKLQMTWEQEFLVGSSPEGSGRALCMVCGAEIQFPSADTAHAHILEQHPHTLDLSPSEKSNILEAWSEGVALLQDVRAEQPSPPNSGSWAWGGGGRKAGLWARGWRSRGIAPFRLSPGCRRRPWLCPRPCQDASRDRRSAGLGGQHSPPEEDTAQGTPAP